VACWYFRLNGFLQIETSGVHPEQGGSQRTDADLLGCVSGTVPAHAGAALRGIQDNACAWRVKKSQSKRRNRPSRTKE
jgi:hypothetical protein